MKKTFILFILSICLCNQLNAQNSSEAKAQINKIKRSSQYLSAEATMATEEEAFSLAKELLVSEINDWIDSKRNGSAVKQIVLQDINSCTQQMDMKRGVKTRAFVYVKKKDIVLIYGDGQIVLNSEENGADLQPLSEISTSAQNGVSAQNGASAVTESSETQETGEVVQDVIEAEVTMEPTTKATPLEQIIAAGTMSELKPIFASFKNDGKISYGNYNANNIADKCYLLFYTREGTIAGILEKSGNNYTDAKDNSSKSLSDFSGCGAYWFILH